MGLGIPVFATAVIWLCGGSLFPFPKERDHVTIVSSIMLFTTPHLPFITYSIGGITKKTTSGNKNCTHLCHLETGIHGFVRVVLVFQKHDPVAGKKLVLVERLSVQSIPSLSGCSFF
jgi:hypothetical protein